MLKNRPVVGFIYGVIGPLIGLLIMKLVWYSSRPMGDYLDMLRHDHETMFKVFSLALLVNLVPFNIFNRRRSYQASKGVLIATMLYVLFIVLVRYVW